MEVFTPLFQAVIAFTAVLSFLLMGINAMLSPIKKDINRMETDIDQLKTDVDQLKTDIKTINAKLDKLLSR